MSYTDSNIGFKLPARTADGTKQPVIVQQISVRPINRQSLDLGKWLQAIKSAEGIIPRRVLLYDLIKNIVTTDGHVIAVWGKREDAVTSADWTFTDKDGKPVDEINQLIDCIGFEDLLKCIVGSKGWGYSMCEPTFFINDNDQHEMSIYDVPKKHMRPEVGIIAKDQNSDTGINIREGIYAKTIMEFGKASDLGLFICAAQYAILKRGSISDWAEFIEIFGRGIIDATWDGFDETQRAKLSQSLEEMGGGGIIIHPEGTKIDIKNNTGNANGQLQGGFISVLNKEISKTLLGSTETTESSTSSGYAQSETHQDQDNKKHETDINFVRRMLNSRFIKVLKAAGFDTRGGTFVLKTKKELTKKEAFEMHKSMVKDLGIPLDDDFFYENYEATKPNNYNELKKQRSQPKNEVLTEKDPEKTAHTPLASEEKSDKKPGKIQTLKAQLSQLSGLLNLFGFSSEPRINRGANQLEPGSEEMLWESPHSIEPTNEQEL